jgi:hypothetical protein
MGLEHLRDREVRRQRQRRVASLRFQRRPEQELESAVAERGELLGGRVDPGAAAPRFARWMRRASSANSGGRSELATLS